MTAPTPCPLLSCRIAEPHAHPTLGEGLFGPAVQPAPNTAQPDAAFALHTIPCVCPKCGAEFEGRQFTALGPGEARRPRTCDACCEVSEERCLAKVMPPPRPNYHDAVSARLPGDE